MTTDHTSSHSSTAPRCVNDGAPATVVLVYLVQGYLLGPVLCEACATCTDTRCAEPGTVRENEYEEPWCAEHAAQWSGSGEPVYGPDIVRLGSLRHQEILAELAKETR